ncbi:hypothetical protein EDB83DRAFT_2502522 [Lactarius deliciosus]|nr:hypothetical protein EDB83DRAFT_2502522 [Lactarius deliciosus]
MTRPRFNPSPCKGSDATTLQFDQTSLSWTPIVTCPADFPPELFELAVSQLTHHPEYNSTLILRSEVIEESTEVFPVTVPLLRGLRPVRNTHRRLLPRRPTRDSGLEQHCTLYAPSHPSGPDAFHPTVLVLTPILPSDGSLPYYYPTVTHLAFRIIPPTSSESAVLRMEALPLPGTPLDQGGRLYRTCLSLLETLHRYGWGTLTHYKKRVLHDVLLPRETYQDLYLIIRERYKHLIDDWHEVTDPLKHVFESSTALGSPTSPWRRWPRPPGGFVDLGCGNGLLTHILVSEGYAGHGFDLRSRTSWDTLPARDPSRAFSRQTAAAAASTLLPADCFLIGNHADELTPWVPLLATRVRAYRTLNLGAGGEGTWSSYALYRAWLAWLSMHCGWTVEVEMLRIPSTRNWAIVGRKRVGSSEEADDNVEELIEGVRKRGQFKTRRPEGKAGGDH